MAKARKSSIPERLAALEARLAMLEGEGSCCAEPVAAPGKLGAQFKAKRVGSPKRLGLGNGTFLCAQSHEIPALKKTGVGHTLVSTWLEKNGRQLGKKTCTCTSGSCSQSKTCDSGVDVSCDCVNCTLTCS